MKTYLKFNREKYKRLGKELDKYSEAVKKFLGIKKEEIRQNMEEEKSKLEELKILYSRVSKQFPGIRPGEIGLEYNDLEDCFAGVRILDGHYRKSLAIRAGRRFSYLDDDEKEAVLAHELGHYYRMKDYSVERLRRIVKWQFESCQYNDSHIVDEKIMRKVKRLQKWFNMQEMNADNLAYKAGYGKPVLKALKRTSERSYEDLSMICKNSLLARIENLENKLRGCGLI